MRGRATALEFFGAVDPSLFEELSLINPEKVGWPLSKEADNPSAPKGTIAVARDSLMTYDPVNDRKGGNILEIKSPGGTGRRGRSNPGEVRHAPRRISSTWKVIALPREEQFTGRE